MPYATLRYAVEGPVATIALDQPETRNALSDEVLGELLAAFAEARADDAVRCVVLTSTHEKVFSAGGNLAGFAADVPLVTKHLETGSRFPALFTAIGQLGKPTHLRGQRARARRRAGPGARLRPDPRARGRALRDARDQRRGVPVHDHGADLPQRRRARRRTSCCCWASRSPREEAERIGIVNRVVPADEFDAAVADWAARLASKSPVLMRLGKDAMFRQQDMALADALAFLQAQLTIAFSTEDIQEGVKAFFEKRDPVWTGR